MLRASMADALGLPSVGADGDDDELLRVSGTATLDSAYPVSDFAAATVATAASALGVLTSALGFPSARASVDRPLVDAWFGMALTPIGWTIPSPWDAIAGDYACLPETAAGDGAAGWIRLHTNAPHHRAAALRVLGVEGDRVAVAAAVARWAGEELEAAVVSEGGCAALLRTPDAWAGHAQGAAVAAEPLVASEITDAGGDGPAWQSTPARPLAGLRVLDLTRVLSGPVATRFLAGLGADVLRIDPPDWDEPAVVPEMTIGKRAARLDARDPAGRDAILALLADADVLVHGYRSDALEALGLGVDVRREARPGLVDVSLDAYGHTGPWAARRGFDSLVQMSTGIAGAGLRSGLADRPTPLPVQALDHGTGYLVAAAVLSGLAARVRTGRGMRSRLSLARTAAALEQSTRLAALPIELAQASTVEPVTAQLAVPSALDTPWGAATLLSPPVRFTASPLVWERSPRPLGSDAPAW